MIWSSGVQKYDSLAHRPDYWLVVVWLHMKSEGPSNFLYPGLNPLSSSLYIRGATGTAGTITHPSDAICTKPNIYEENISSLPLQRGIRKWHYESAESRRLSRAGCWSSGDDLDFTARLDGVKIIRRTVESEASGRNTRALMEDRRRGRFSK